MKFNRDIFLLYGITDRALTGEKKLEEQIEEALSSGVTLLQLREKNLKAGEFLEEALRIRKITERFHVPLIINDSVDIALKCSADGVHIGQNDMPVQEARKRLGPDGILGVTAKTMEQARQAYEAGADYLGSGALFQSPTKKNAIPLTREGLTQICECVPIPVVAVGGIRCENVLVLEGTGVAGAAVVSGIFGQENIKKAVQDLRGQLKKVVKP